MSMSTIWLIVLVVSVIVELITLDLVSIWFSIGAVIAFFLSLLGLNSTIQIIMFIVITLLALTVTRPLANRFLKGNVVKTNADRIIGKQAIVLKEISRHSKGEVKVIGSIWTAVSVDNQLIEKDSLVEIVAIEGVKAVVKKN
jgi:Membrane protein implicated in regulation of membrane protease activity